MAHFVSAMKYLASLEGGYVNDPDDRGGATKYGISLNFYKQNIDRYADESDIQALTREDAENIYREWFWYPSGVAALDSRDLANRVFALVVNAGIKPAVRVLQRAVNQTVRSEDDHWGIAVDGVLGPETAENANEIPESQLLPDFRLAAMEFYLQLLGMEITKVRRTQFDDFEKGWLRRALL